MGTAASRSGLAAALVGLATALVGCGTDELQVDMARVVTAPPHADEAMLALSNAYAMRSMPAVYWYGAAGLDCGDGVYFHDQKGRCVGGNELNQVIAIARPDGLLIHEFLDQFGYVMLAHEFGHAASEQRGEGGCSDHQCHWFWPGWEVDQASAFLVKLGI